MAYAPNGAAAGAGSGSTASAPHNSSGGGKTSVMLQAEQMAVNADAHFENKRFAAASAAYQKALGLCAYHESAPDWYNSTGRAEQELDHLDSAVLWYGRAITRAPTESAYYNNRGMVQRKLGKPHLALEDYNTAIRLNQQNAFPLYNRAMLLRDDPLKWTIALFDLQRAKQLFTDSADQEDCDVELSKLRDTHGAAAVAAAAGVGGGPSGSGGVVGDGVRLPAIVASVAAVPSPSSAASTALAAAGGGVGGMGGVNNVHNGGFVVTLPLMATIASPGGMHTMALPPIPGPVQGLPQLYPPLPPPPVYPPPPTVPAAVRPPATPALQAPPQPHQQQPPPQQQYVPLNGERAGFSGQPITTATLVAGPQNLAVAASLRSSAAAALTGAGGAVAVANDSAATVPPLSAASNNSAADMRAAAAAAAGAGVEGFILPPTPANGAGLLDGVSVGSKRKCPDPEDFSLGLGDDTLMSMQAFGALSDADLLTLDLMGGVAVATPGPNTALLPPPPLMRTQSLEQLQRSLNQELPALPSAAGVAAAAVPSTPAAAVAAAAPAAPAPLAPPPQPVSAAAAALSASTSAAAAIIASQPYQPPLKPYQPQSSKRHKPDPALVYAAANSLPSAPLPPLAPVPAAVPPPPVPPPANDELDRLRRELADLKQSLASLVPQQQPQQQPPKPQATDAKHTGLTPNAEPATPAGPGPLLPPLTPALGAGASAGGGGGVSAAQAALNASAANGLANPLAAALKVPPTPFNIASPAPPSSSSTALISKPMSPFTSSAPAPSPPAQSGVHPSPRTAAAAAAAAASAGKSQGGMVRSMASPRTGAAAAPSSTTGSSTGGSTGSSTSSSSSSSSSGTATAPTLPVEQWSSTDVVQWLRAIGPVYAAYAPSFELNALNGIALLRLDVNLLRELGVKHVLHQHRLLSEFATLRAAAVSRNPALAALLPAHVALPLASAVVAAAGTAAASAAAAAANSSALTVTPGGPAAAAAAGAGSAAIVTPGNPLATASAPPPSHMSGLQAHGVGGPFSAVAHHQHQHAMGLAGLGSRATGVSAAAAARVLAGLDVPTGGPKDVVLFPSGAGVMNPFLSTSSSGGPMADDYWFRTVVDMRRQHDDDKQQWAVRFDEALERVHAQYRHRLLLLEHDKQYSDSKRIELEQKLKDIHDHRQCVVCMDGPRGVRFGCGHVCVCTACADRLALDPKFQCPLCQRPVTERCTVYFG